VQPAAAPERPADQELTLAEAFHLLTRALGEMPAPVPHEALRGRMAALHGREDSLLDAANFPRLLRQANDAEVADVRLVADGQFEVSPHKTDLAMQLRPTPEPTADGATAPMARPAAALRFRSGSGTSRRAAMVPMVGVIKLDVPETPAPEPTVEAAPDANTKKRSRGGAKRAKKAAAARETTKAAAPKEAEPKAAKRSAKRPKRTAKKKPDAS
jgi:hypothetical protein